MPLLTDYSGGLPSCVVPFFMACHAVACQILSLLTLAFRDFITAHLSTKCLSTLWKTIQGIESTALTIELSSPLTRLNGSSKLYVHLLARPLSPKLRHLLVIQDDSVSAYKPAVYKCHQDLTSREQAIQVDIVTSDSSVAPTRYDDCVKNLCTIKASQLPSWTDLPIHTSEDGHAFRHIEYDLRMLSDGSSLEFKICHGDQTLASESVMFDSTIQPKEKRGKLYAKADTAMKDSPYELDTKSEAPPSIVDSDDEYVTGVDDNGDESSDDSDSTEGMDCDSDGGDE